MKTDNLLLSFSYLSLIIALTILPACTIHNDCEPLLGELDRCRAGKIRSLEGILDKTPIMESFKILGVIV